jgi:hypothetical protein
MVIPVRGPGSGGPARPGVTKPAEHAAMEVKDLDLAPLVIPFATVAPATTRLTSTAT